MIRPQYKQLYLDQKARADELATRCLDLDEKLTLCRAVSLDTSRERARLRGDFSILHQHVTNFLDRLYQDILTGAGEKNGWLYIPAIDPETSQAFMRKLGVFRAHVDKTKPPGL